MKTIQRIAVTLVAILLAGGLLAAPAQADDPREPVPSECTTYTGPLAERAATMLGELRTVYGERDQYRAQFVQQRDRAEAFKAQVARKDAKIAELREKLAEARK